MSYRYYNPSQTGIAWKKDSTSIIYELICNYIDDNQQGILGRRSADNGLNWTTLFNMPKFPVWTPVPTERYKAPKSIQSAKEAFRYCCSVLVDDLPSEKMFAAQPWWEERLNFVMFGYKAGSGTLFGIMAHPDSCFFFRYDKTGYYILKELSGTVV